MGNATLRDGDTVFLYRVAGVAVSEDRVLLHRSEHDEFWALPGGRIQVGETAADALAREMREETGTDVAVGELLWVVENFFEHYPLDQPPDPSVGTAHHEIGLYLKMDLPPHLTDTTGFAGREAAGTAHEFALEFRWFGRAELSDLDVRPVCMRELLTQPLPDGVPHVVDVG